MALSSVATAKEYTLCFLVYQHDILLLNRRKTPWMGNWNGVGGKRNAGESLLDCALREVQEETGYAPTTYTVRATGRLMWMEEGQLLGTLYLYWMELHDPPVYERYPANTDEGILAFHTVEWATSCVNTGVVSNLPAMITALQGAAAAATAAEEERVVEFECDYDKQGHMTRMTQLR